jgi:hypothetical protein
MVAYWVAPPVALHAGAGDLLRLGVVSGNGDQPRDRQIAAGEGMPVGFQLLAISLAVRGVLGEGLMRPQHDGMTALRRP